MVFVKMRGVGAKEDGGGSVGQDRVGGKWAEVPTKLLWFVLNKTIKLNFLKFGYGRL